MERARSEAFSSEFAKLMLGIGDCSSLLCEGSDTTEYVRQQLFSKYYGHECGKYFAACSPIGGTTAVSPCQGGPASDHQCMVAAELFEEKKWAVDGDTFEPEFLYDAGVSAKSKTLAMSAGCKLVTSGITRKSKTSNLSTIQRNTNFRVSSLRIRVENFIGIVKQRFKILTSTIDIADLGMMDDIVYACFMLHNFGPPIIK